MGALFGKAAIYDASFAFSLQADQSTTVALRPSSQWTAVGFEPTTPTTLACWKAGALTN